MPRKVRVKSDWWIHPKREVKRGDVLDVVSDEYEDENLILGILGGRWIGVKVLGKDGKPVFLLRGDFDYADGLPPPAPELPSVPDADGAGWNGDVPFP